MKIRNINFRQTSSERSATGSYRNFAKYLKEKFARKGADEQSDGARLRAKRDKGGQYAKS